MSTKLKVCFNGCSFTVGEGFEPKDRDTYIYDRLVTRAFDFSADNIAEGGSSNYRIFLRSVDAILKNRYDIVITQWTALNRVWLSPSPNVYFFVNSKNFPAFPQQNVEMSATEIEKFKETLLLLNHDYQNILDVLDYTRILTELGQAHNVKTVFINGLLPWTPDLAEADLNNLADSLSDYTKTILDFDLRDDKELKELLYQVQKKFNQIDKKLWVNLFDSFFNQQVDLGPEGHHPGINSHKLMATQLINYLDKQL